jgi:hypothetical protein
VNSNVIEQNILNNDMYMEKFLPLLELPMKTHVASEKATSTIDCVKDEKKQDISESMLDYQVDPKVRPYEVFVKMITSNEQLEMASNAAFLTELIL